jgi:hypothetical protein
MNGENSTPESGSVKAFKQKGAQPRNGANSAVTATVGGKRSRKISTLPINELGEGVIDELASESL